MDASKCVRSFPYKINPFQQHLRLLYAMHCYHVYIVLVMY